MSGAERIAAERRRQVEVEGWTAEHDAAHDDGALAWAAVCYAAPYAVYMLDDPDEPGDSRFRDPWPWNEGSDKRPRDALGELVVMSRRQRIRCLEKAGALLAAEIDRLEREDTLP